MPISECNAPCYSLEEAAKYRRRSSSGSGIIQEGWRAVDSLRDTMSKLKPSTDEVATNYFMHAGESHHLAYLSDSLLRGLNAVLSNAFPIRLEAYDIVEKAMTVADNGHALDIGERNAAIAMGVMMANERFLTGFETSKGMLDRHSKALFQLSGRAQMNSDGEVWGTVPTKIDGIICDYYYAPYAQQPSRVLVINPLS